MYQIKKIPNRSSLLVLEPKLTKQLSKYYITSYFLSVTLQNVAYKEKKNLDGQCLLLRRQSINK